MFDVLFTHIQEKVELTDHDRERIKTFFRSKKLRKRQYVLQEGEVCKHLSFVSRGMVRSYTVDEKGNEHINLFGWEGWWISDFESFIFGNEAVLNIDAIEDTELLLLYKENYDTMLSEIPILERYFRMLYQNSLATKDRRLISSNTYTAEEKYLQFVKTYPLVSKRIPQNSIASYLGLSPETISRVKRNILKRST